MQKKENTRRYLLVFTIKAMKKLNGSIGHCKFALILVYLRQDDDEKLSDDDNDESYVQPLSIKRPRLESEYALGRNLRERKHEEKKGPLYFLLDYLQRTLQKYARLARFRCA